MSKAEQFRQNIVQSRRASYAVITRKLEEEDPDLLVAILDALKDETAAMAAIHRSLEAVGVEIGYSSLLRWRDDIRR